MFSLWKHTRGMISRSRDARALRCWLHHIYKNFTRYLQLFHNISIGLSRQHYMKPVKGLINPFAILRNISKFISDNIWTAQGFSGQNFVGSTLNQRCMEIAFTTFNRRWRKLKNANWIDVNDEITLIIPTYVLSLINQKLTVEPTLKQRRNFKSNQRTLYQCLVGNVEPTFSKRRQNNIREL